MKIKTGKRYVMRNGEISGVIKNDPTPTEFYKFTDGCYCFCENGSGAYSGKEMKCDLMYEYKEPSNLKNIAILSLYFSTIFTYIHNPNDYSLSAFVVATVALGVYHVYFKRNTTAR